MDLIVSKFLGIIGILIIFFILWIISENKRNFPFRIIIIGIFLQIILAIIILYIPITYQIFQWIGDRVKDFLDFSKKGTEFLFGNIGKAESNNVFGFQFAIIISSTIIFFSAFVSILYKYGIIQKIVYGIACLMQKTLKTSGVESLVVASNIFLGQTEAPLLVRHYLGNVSRSELLTIMTGGFATIAGGVMAAYIQMGISPVFLITASLISAPGSIILSKIVVPPSSDILSLKEIKNISIPQSSNLLDAITQGAGDGMKLSLNIIAVLIAFISLIALIDAGLNIAHQWLSTIGFVYFPKSLKEIFGFIFQPFAYFVGVPASEAKILGSLIGTKISLNEFLAYADLSQLILEGKISARTASIATFALCGFANFGSIAVQIGGLGALVPEKRAEIARLGFKAMFIGALVNLLTAIIASFFI
ncbi:MAG: NupC/NupG family nucleoside CNT transporter [Candidatus Kapabacteria bacterium]|nr:NupC/NupG family nucleoside CNT transporter [Candidatus Kapabacteria bacterium]